MRTFTYAGPDGIEMEATGPRSGWCWKMVAAMPSRRPRWKTRQGPCCGWSCGPRAPSPGGWACRSGSASSPRSFTACFRCQAPSACSSPSASRHASVEPRVRGSVELAEVVGRNVTSVVETEHILAVGHPHALAGFGREGLDWCVIPENIAQISLVTECRDTLYAIAVLGDEQVVALELDPSDGASWTSRR